VHFFPDKYRVFVSFLRVYTDYAVRYIWV